MYSQPSPSPNSQPSSPTLPQDAGSRRSAPLVKGGRSRILNILMGLIAGILIGVVGTLLVLLAVTSSPYSAAPPSQGVNGSMTVTVQFGQAYLTKLAQQHLSGANLPGTISNVQVTTTHNAPIVITADDQIGILGLTVSRQVTIDIQPYVQDCHVHMHVTHADLAGVALTSYAATLENQLNQQLTINSSTLPHGFTYCATSVDTENSGVLVTLTATPTNVTPTK